jgi:hypothetical protein
LRNEKKKQKNITWAIPTAPAGPLAGPSNNP